MTLEISVKYSDLISKIKQHLTMIGKRAKNVNGESMYSDLTTSYAEDNIIWKDFCESSAELVVGALSSLSGSYETDTEGISFSITSTRWKELSNAALTDLTEALGNAIGKFIWNNAVLDFLSIIHPGTGAKYPPQWANPYNERTRKLLSVILDLAYLKRPSSKTARDYSDMTGEVVTEQQ